MKSSQTITQRYRINSCGESDIGLVRENNEDAWFVLPEEKIYLLADGMGGHSAGEVASNETIQSLTSLIKENYSEEVKLQTLKERRRWLRKLIERTNRRVYSLSRKDRELRGMGTTLCLVSFHQEGAVLAHVGDSRIYRLRDRQIEQLTEDHSLVSEMIELGELHPKKQKETSYRHVITKAIGTEPSVDPTLQVTDIQIGDQFMLCSDGLSDLLSAEEMTKILVNHPPLEESVQGLIQAANRKGGQDNITVVLMEIKEDHEGDDLS